MKIFILGCGFVGSKLAEFFKSRGDLVTVTTTTLEKTEHLKQIAHEVILLNETENLEKWLNHQDVLIVCAAPKNPNLYKEAYLDRALQVQKVLEKNTFIKQVIYTSSCSVYGEKQGRWVDENQPLEPVNDKQTILVETEKIYLNKLPNSIRTCVFRLGEIYGLEKDIKIKIEALLQSHRLISGNNYTNLVHVEDIVRAVDFCLKKELVGVYNLCNDSHLTRKEFYLKWCDYLKLPPPHFNLETEGAHHGNKRVSNQKIKLLGFEFQHPLADPLRSN